MKGSHGEKEDKWSHLGEFQSGFGAPVVAGGALEHPEKLIHRMAALENPSDEMIARATQHLIEIHPAVLARDLAVTVSSGEITLRGVVEDEGMRVAAQELARTVPGAKSVVNHLKVEHSSLHVQHRRW